MKISYYGFKKAKKNKKTLIFCQSGFTLIEMLVAVSIFAIAMVVLVQIFLAASNAQQKSTAVQKAQAEARYALETMSRKIREGYINYSQYANPIPDTDGDGISNAQNKLALVDIQENRIVFERSTVGCPTGVANCLKMTSSGITQNLTGAALEVQTLSFYLSPVTDPFIADFNPSTGSQPRVTITMAIQSLGPEPATVFIQTTVSLRFYKR